MTRFFFRAVLLVLVGAFASPAMAGTIHLKQANGTVTEQTGTGSAADVNLNTLISGENQAANLMMVTPQALSTGGATTSRYISVGSTEDEHAICTAACTLYSITATNVNAAVRYLKCNNATAANTTPGTSVPEIDLAIPGPATGGVLAITFPVGAAFDTALTCWLVTGAAENDVAEVAANELKVLYTYKQ